MSIKSVYFKAGGQMTESPPTEPDVTPRSLSDTEYDYRLFAEEAARSKDQCIRRITEWNNLLVQWKIESPDEDTRKKAEVSAIAALALLEQAGPLSEDRRNALAAKLKTLPVEMEEQEKAYRKKLETHYKTLCTACKSINKQLPKARASLNALLGHGQDGLLSSWVNWWLGRTPHLPSPSKEPVSIVRDERKQKGPPHKGLTLGSYLHEDHIPELKEQEEEPEIVEIKDLPPS